MRWIVPLKQRSAIRIFFSWSVGSCIWLRLRDRAGWKPGGVIGDDILEVALRNSRIARDTYYADRYRELRIRSLLPAAVSVAEIFRSNNAKAITAAAFEDAVSGSVDAKLDERAKASGAQDAALWAEDELRNLGFIWSQVGEERFCEPGLPGLMGYVVELAVQRRNERSR